VVNTTPRPFNPSGKISDNAEKTCSHNISKLGNGFNKGNCRNISTSAEKITMTTVVKSNPITGLDKPLGFQEAEGLRFLVNRHLMVVRLYAPAAFTHRKIPQCDPRAIVGPKELCQ
jgi:hypothetical protein